MTETLTKDDLIRSVATQTGQPAIVVRKVMDSLTVEITEHLIEGGRVVWPKFGVFERRERKSPLPGASIARPGRGGEKDTWKRSGTALWISFRAATSVKTCLRDEAARLRGNQ